ncbi:hypothetical protein AB6D63_22135 [Vibrio splendidus]
MINYSTETFSDMYGGVLLNRHQMFKTHNKEQNQARFLLQSAIYFVVILSKIILAKFLIQTDEVKHQKIIGLNFSVYKHRFRELSQDLVVVDYLYKQFNVEQIRLFKYVSFTQVINLLLERTTEEKQQHKKFKAHSVFYRFVCAAEYLLLESFIREHKFDEVVTAGLNDRYCIFLSSICKKLNVDFSIIQHGALTKFEGCYLIEGTRFYYMYDFSKLYLKYFFKNAETIEFLPCERKLKQQELSISNHEKNLAFACTPSNIHLNYQIIDIMISELNPEVNIYIHPHPREDVTTYKKRYSSIKNVIVTKNKIKNIEFLVTRISSLGVELEAVGIVPVFINLEEHETDYLATGKYQTFTTLPSFKSWLHCKSSIADEYKK